MRKNKGITLIALVVTIIVLIILAAVSLSMLLGENGIITNAQEASQSTRRESGREQIAMVAMASYDNTGKFSETIFKSEIAKVPGATIKTGDGVYPIVVELDGYEYEVAVNGEVTTTGQTTGGTVTPPAATGPELDTDGKLKEEYYLVLPEPDGRKITIPKDFKVADLNTDGTVKPTPKQANEIDEYLKNNIDNGIVVIAPDNSEFVWVPVENPVLKIPTSKTEDEIKLLIDNSGKYPMAIKIEGQDNYRGVLYGYTGTDSISISAVKHSSTTRIEPNNLYTTYDNTTNLPGWESTLFQNEYNFMVKEVQAKGGFYIGRYETSIRTGNIVQSKKLMSPMTAEATSGNNWYGMYLKQKNYRTDNTITGIQSAMIYGSQWEQVMIWMKNVVNPYESNALYLLNSKGLGNYSWIAGKDNWSDSSVAPTGCVDVRNIYDMAGNLHEWTQESYRFMGLSHRVYRGGNYICTGDGGIGTATTPVSGIGTTEPTIYRADIGSRLVLY